MLLRDKTKATVKQIMESHDCVYVEADCNYVYIHTQSKSILYSLTLKRLCERYPYLIRIHRHVAINPQFIGHIRHDYQTKSVFLIVANGVELKVSRRQFRALRDQFRAIVAENDN